MADGKCVSDRDTAPVVHDEAGSLPATAVAAPLFRFDPGWMFVLAGLAVCAAGVLLPAQADLHALRQQMSELKTEESRWYARLKAHGDFLDQVDREEPDLVRRLAATQLNMILTTETPVLLAATGTPPLTQWIDHTVKVEKSPVKPLPISSLSRLANGPDRLWLFAGGIMCVFIGLLMGPGLVRSRWEDAESQLLLDDREHDQAIDQDEHEHPATSTVLIEDEGEDEELLSQDQVQSNVLVEVPPASRTMEAKELPESSASAMSSTTMEIGVAVKQPPPISIDSLNDETESSAQDECGQATEDQAVTELQDEPAPASTRPPRNSAENREQAPGANDDEQRTPLVEATDEGDDADADDDEEWPLSRRTHRSNRFEDSDEPHERSSRD